MHIMKNINLEGGVKVSQKALKRAFCFLTTHKAWQ